LTYNREKTFSKFDNVSFKDFADDVKLPPEMQLMFTTFSRAFFAEPQYISMAELIKSFHSYFLVMILGCCMMFLMMTLRTLSGNPRKIIWVNTSQQYLLIQKLPRLKRGQSIYN